MLPVPRKVRGDCIIILSLSLSLSMSLSAAEGAR
jgi:hypothetical protein